MNLKKKKKALNCHSCFFTLDGRRAEEPPLWLRSRGKQKEGEGSPSAAITHAFLHVHASGRGALCGLPDFIIWKGKPGLINGPLGGKHLSPYSQYNLHGYGAWINTATDPHAHKTNAKHVAPTCFNRNNLAKLK